MGWAVIHSQVMLRFVCHGIVFSQLYFPPPCLFSRPLSPLNSLSKPASTLFIWPLLFLVSDKTPCGFKKEKKRKEKEVQNDWQKRKWTTGQTSPRKASMSILCEFAPASYRIDLENLCSC